MRTYSLIAAVISALVSPVIPALAGTISTNSVTVTQADFVNGNLTLTVPDFDPSLGTLTSASLSLVGIAQPQFEVINLGNVSGTGTGSSVITFTVSGAGVSGLAGSASSGTQTVTVPGTFLDMASSSPVFVFLNPSVLLTDLAALIGTGTTGFNVSESIHTIGTTITKDATLAFGGTASANLALDMTYTYTAADPVPEPMSAALLGAGMLGLPMIRRLRRRRHA